MLWEKGRRERQKEVIIISNKTLNTTSVPLGKKVKLKVGSFYHMPISYPLLNWFCHLLLQLYSVSGSQVTLMRCHLKKIINLFFYYVFPFKKIHFVGEKQKRWQCRKFFEKPRNLLYFQRVANNHRERGVQKTNSVCGCMRKKSNLLFTQKLLSSKIRQ